MFTMPVLFSRAISRIDKSAPKSTLITDVGAKVHELARFTGHMRSYRFDALMAIGYRIVMRQKVPVFFVE